MERWSGKVAVVTGASSGIGLETAKVLVQRGLIVVGLARRKAQMEEGMRDARGPGQFHAKDCDITSETSVSEAFEWIERTVGTVNVLVNNAGYVKHSKIEDTATEELERTINVNLRGLLYCSKRAIGMMKENQAEAHIVNVNSTLGHKVLPAQFGSFNVYPATKYAVTALSETLKNELADSKIRVSSISPGLVKTAMMDAAAETDARFETMPALDPVDVANSILHIVGAPSHVLIEELKLNAKHLKA